MLTKKQVMDAGYTVIRKGAWYRLDPMIDPRGWDDFAKTIGFDPSCEEVILCVCGYKEIFKESNDD